LRTSFASFVCFAKRSSAFASFSTDILRSFIVFRNAFIKYNDTVCMLASDALLDIDTDIGLVLDVVTDIMYKKLISVIPYFFRSFLRVCKVSNFIHSNVHV